MVPTTPASLKVSSGELTLFDSNRCRLVPSISLNEWCDQANRGVFFPTPSGMHGFICFPAFLPFLHLALIRLILPEFPIGVLLALVGRCSSYASSFAGAFRNMYT